MTKTAINTIIRNLTNAKIVTKASPWMFEGMGNKKLEIRYVGIKPYEDWLDIMSEKNNLLLKFTLDKKNGFLEFFLANQPPFVRINGTKFSEGDKWETLLGELKRRLKKDKEEYLNHQDKMGNLYKLMALILK
jgi:hypothetical protein